MADADGKGAAHAAIDKANELYTELLKRKPKGIAESSMGKFKAFQEWLADELDLGDYRKTTYAVGSAGTAHNFKSRWAQNNQVSGSRRPLGIGFMSIPAGVDKDTLVDTALNTSKDFVEGSVPTSFEVQLFFVEPFGTKQLEASAILAFPGSAIAKKLQQLFPDAKYREVPWVRSARPKPFVSESSAQGSQSGSAKFGKELLADLISALDGANYQAPEGLARRVVASLVAKPFLILAGLSGSGKTLLAISTARWMSEQLEQAAIVAVGADWTSTHHLLGYADALDETRYVRTKALDLLLRAWQDPARPYFLILDEMNLSHVERYFSDFLSAMESGAEIHLHGVGTGKGDVPASLPFPRNLFVIGTINVDETTYMFSPKVIDRANVIDFGVTAADIAAYVDRKADFSPDDLLGGGSSYGVALVEAVEAERGLSDLEGELARVARAGILGSFGGMDLGGMQFGFRTSREMGRYFSADAELLGDDWKAVEAIDVQIAQRLLPRLNGDVGKLRNVLIGLLALCERFDDYLAGDDLELVRTRMAELAALPPSELDVRGLQAVARWPLTASKIRRMLRRLQEYGFATAIEA